MTVGPYQPSTTISLDPYKTRLSSVQSGQEQLTSFTTQVTAQRRIEEQQRQFNEQQKALEMANARAQQLLQRARTGTLRASQAAELARLQQRYGSLASGGTVYTGSSSVAQQMAANGQNLTKGGVNGLINYAKTLIGTPYSWGGGTVKGPSKGIAQGRNTVGFDCSSFVQNVFAKMGAKLPRTASAQYAASIKISRNQLQPGDLVVYGGKRISHIAIYIGNGKIIESPRTGLSVRITNIGNPRGYARVGGMLKGSTMEGLERKSSGSTSEFNRFVNAIRRQESGGNYKAVNKSSGALGAYQIMPANIPSWSKKALGYTITKKQFLNNRGVQDKIARYMLNYYYKKYGVRGAAIAWYAGESRAKQMKNVSGGKGYPTSYQYIDQILAKM